MNNQFSSENQRKRLKARWDKYDYRAAFWRNVEKTDECWLWIGHKNRRYGAFKLRQKNHWAHRLSWEWANGRSIPDGMCILHTCDVPLCVRPDHLRLGTQKDNIADMISKGRDRKARGEHNRSAKLTEANVRSIRSSERSARELAFEHGVSAATIEKVRARRSWRHVGD